MLNVNINKTSNGIASKSVGSSATRATNQHCNKNSRQANGLRGINTNVSKAGREEVP